MSNANDPAYPALVKFMGEISTANHGLTKRELFAAMAMQGILSNPYLIENFVRNGKLNEHMVEKCAIEFADNLIARLPHEDPCP